MARRGSRIPGPNDTPFPGMPTPPPRPPRPRVKSIGKPTPQVKSAAPSAQQLGVSQSTGNAQAARATADRTMDYETALAIQAAKEGDDSQLLPYQPTPSINPPRPRTLAAGYDAKTQTLRIRFRDGVGYEYYNVPPRVWRNFKRVKSPGRAVNRVLNNYEYSRADW